MHNPWCIKVELTEGCNRRCVWCGCSNEELFPVGKYSFLTIDLAKKISSSMKGWLPKPRIEFTLNGEPTFNPHALDIISIFRQDNPKAQIMITTNGCVVTKRDFKKNVQEYFDAGVNIFILDTYIPERDKVRKIVIDSGMDFIDFGKDNFVPWRYISSKINVLLLMDDIRELSEKDIHKNILNHCGAVDIERAKEQGINIQIDELPYKKKCVLPFREMVVKHNGDIILCCNDYTKALTFGNVLKEPLEDLWNADRLNTVRSLLYRKDRRFNPCGNCNFRGGFRQGIGLSDLFPDKSNEELFDKLYPNG